MAATDVDVDEIAVLAELFPGRQIERVGGQIIMGPNARARHSRLIRKLVVALDAAVPAVAEVFPEQSVQVGDDRLCPDLAVYISAQVDLDEIALQATPVLVVEVLSPSTADHDTVRKRAIWDGVAAYVVVDPETEAAQVLCPPPDDTPSWVADLVDDLTS